MAKFFQYSLALFIALANAGNANVYNDDDDRFNADVSIKFDKDCGYELTFSFVHDEDLPIGSPDVCDPTKPVTAPDGLPYLASRSMEYRFSDEIYEATGFASQGLDFNPCGHPPLAFAGPHYDAHFYTKPAEVREHWTCDLLPGAPICNFLDLSLKEPVLDIAAAQSTDSGRAFFNVATVLGTDGVLANMPANFRCDPDHAVPGMGEHCWDFDTMPDTFEDWVEPSTVMGTYNADIAFFETMFTLGFVTGKKKQSYRETVQYKGQTISTLPSEYKVESGGRSGRTTIILHGTRAFCEKRV